MNSVQTAFFTKARVTVISINLRAKRRQLAAGKIRLTRSKKGQTLYTFLQPQSTDILLPIKKDEGMNFIKDVVCKTYSNASSSKKKKCILIIYVIIYTFMFLDSSISASLLNFSIWAYINRSHFIFSRIIKISAKLHYILPPVDKFAIYNFLSFMAFIYVIYHIQPSTNSQMKFYPILCDIRLTIPNFIATLSIFYYLYFRYPLPHYIIHVFPIPFSPPTMCTTISLISDIHTIAEYERKLAEINLQKINKEQK